MKAGALQFYPIHKILTNFTEKARRRHTLSRATVIAHISVSFSTEEEKQSVWIVLKARRRNPYVLKGFRRYTKGLSAQLVSFLK